MQNRAAYVALSVISGLLLVVLGVLFLTNPKLTLASVILLVGTFAIVYGLALAVSGLMGREESRGWAVAAGLLAVIMGIVILVWPAATGLMVLYIVAAWAVITGVTDIAAAFMSALSGGRRVWLLLIGLLGIAVGVVFFVHPLTGILALLWLVGVYLVALGVLRIIAGFMLPPAQPA